MNKLIHASTLDLATFQPVFTTVTRVPIVMAGVEYMLATGPATFTPEDIMDFVASQDDPAIVSPRLKIGHTSRLSDPRADGILRDGDDGVPALGRFVNIDFDSDSITAVGDIAGVPSWLASMLKAGLLYPSRSIEGFQGAVTVTGKEWGLVVHAVALLGCVWPGCSTLDDLPLLYTEGGPDDLELYDEKGELIAVGAAQTAVAASGRARTAAATRPVEASVNVDDVRRAFYNNVRDLDLDIWAWIRAVYIDPNELIVDNDDGELYRVPFTTDGDEVEFSEPVEVNIQYVDASVPAIRRQISLTASRGRRVAVYASREESRPAVQSNSNGGNMTPEQLAAIGLPATASAAQIHARLITLAAEHDPETAPETPPPANSTPPPAVEEPDDDDEPDDDEPDSPPPPATTASVTPEAIAALRAAGLAVVPQSTLDSIQRDAATGATHAREEAEASRERDISAAIRDGRIRSGDAPTYRNMYASAATAALARTLLTASVEQGGLRPGMIPVEERGEVPSGDPAIPGDGGIDASSYDESWLTPAERARVASIKAGTYEPPQIQSDVSLKNAAPSAA